MALLDPTALKQSAQKSLSSTDSDPRKIVIVHTGAVLLLSLILTVVNILLNRQMESTGGLSGVGTRSMLQTAQWVLQILQLLLIPFWQAGYIYAMLKISRGESADVPDLLQGFRRFGPVLRVTLLQGIFYFFIAILATNLASVVFSVTPWAAPLRQALASNASEEVLMAAIQESSLPILLISLVFLVALAAPIFYKFRMAQYRIVDKDNDGALAAVVNSRILMKGNCKALFKVDLSYWWYYLLEILVTAVCYGDMILSMLGIHLPFSATAAALIFMVLYLALQLALDVWKKNEVSLTYTHVYHTLLDDRMKAAQQARQQFRQSQQPEQTQSDPGNQPWDY